MNVLVVFGRAPGEESGKSRLREALGGEPVDSLCRAFLEDIMGWELPVGTSLLVALTEPPDGLANAVPHARFVVQPTAGFGERISSAVAAAFDWGATRAIIVGTDAPTLPAETLAACFGHLAEHRATLVPAIDGGWVALGIERPLGDALRDVPWSTATTYEATRQALCRDGRSPLILAPWYDVDDLRGLRRLHAEVRDPQAAARAPHTAAVLADLHL